MKEMISYQEALQLIQKEAETCLLEMEEVCLQGSEGRILARDILARDDNPGFSNSAMDGFLIKESLMGSPEKLVEVPLRVEKMLPAGHMEKNFQEDVLEIMTGALVPNGYSTVVKVEDVEIVDQTHEYKLIKIATPPENHQNIRLKGSDIGKGEVLLKKGTQLTSFHLVSLASQGISKVEVYKRLSLGIVSTGDEIVPYDQEVLGLGEVRNTSSVFLSSNLNGPLSCVVSYKLLQDSKEEFKSHIQSLIEKDISIIVSTGAVSMGQFDFVCEALMEMGAQILFHKVKIRPGKPVLFAKIIYNNKTKYFFGMPGNPVSTIVGTQFFINPFLRYAYGQEDIKKVYLKASSNFKKADGFTCFYRARIFSENQETKVSLLPNQLSYVVSQGLDFNAWAILKEEGSAIKENDFVEVCLV